MDIEFKNEKPKYIELYEAICEKINNGSLKKGEKLPSKRELSIDLNISLNTIMMAYDLLVDEGYIYSEYKKGYYVADQITIEKKVSEHHTNEATINSYKYDFTTGSVSNFSSSSFKKIVKNILSGNEYLNKTPLNGDLGLRKAISSHLFLNRGIKANPNNIYIGSGTEILRSILRILEIDNISLENPGYHKLAQLALNLGLKCNYLALDDNGVIVPNNKTILYATPFNQYPTGIKMSITRKKELVKFLNETKSFLIEDDFDAEFRIKEGPKTSIYSLDSNRVIFFSTFTETIYPGLRLSYVILPDEIKKKYDEHYIHYSNTVPTLEQLIIRDFIDSGEYARYINKRKKEYLEKRQIITNILEKNDIKYYKDRNYLSVLANVDIQNEIEFKKKLNELSVNINMLNSFDVNGNSNNILIIGYTSIDLEDIENGLNLIINCIRKGSE